MAFDVHSLQGYSTIASVSGSNPNLTIVVQTGDGSKFGNPQNVIIWPAGAQPTLANSTIGRISNISSNTLTVTTAQETSSNITVSSGMQIANGITPKVLTDIESNFNLGATSLSASAITLGYAQNTSAPTFSSGTPTAVSGLTINPTLPGTRNVKVTVYTGQVYNTAATTTTISIYSGATSAALTTLLQSMTLNTGGLNTDTTVPAILIYIAQAPAAGSIWYTAAVSVGAGTATFYTSAASPGFILAEAI